MAAVVRELMAGEGKGAMVRVKAVWRSCRISGKLMKPKAGLPR